MAVQLRITGSPAQCAQAVAALAAGFVVSEVSRFYPNRGAAHLGRVYLDAEVRPGPAPRPGGDVAVLDLSGFDGPVPAGGR